MASVMFPERRIVRDECCCRGVTQRRTRYITGTCDTIDTVLLIRLSSLLVDDVGLDRARYPHATVKNCTAVVWLFMPDVEIENMSIVEYRCVRRKTGDLSISFSPSTQMPDLSMLSYTKYGRKRLNPTNCHLRSAFVLRFDRWCVWEMLEIIPPLLSSSGLSSTT